MTQEIAKTWLIVGDEIGFGDGGGAHASVSLAADVFVLAVWVKIAEAWNGTNPTIDAGDGLDPDGWVDNTEVTEGTVGTYRGTPETTGAYCTKGKVYTAADTIDLTLLVPGDCTQGKARVLALVADISGRET